MAAKQCQILRCSCKHEWQDSKYGRGFRVHNPKFKEKQFVCTVCSNVKDLSGGGKK